MKSPEQAVMAAILLCLGGAVPALLLSRRRSAAGWFAFAVTAASAALVLSAVARVLARGPGHPDQFLALPGVGFSMRLHVDGLSSLFLLVAVLVAAPAALFSVRYLDRYPEYGVGRYYPHFLILIASVYGLLSTTDTMWCFFALWQMMTLSGCALIRFEYRKGANVRAANRFLGFMELACGATMAGSGMLAHGGGPPALRFDFEQIGAHMPILLAARPFLAAAAFALLLAGFGIKMGMWPFGQWWVPDADPAAPSPVGAILSGLVNKTGAYGMIRYFLWLVPASGSAEFPIARWGWVIALLGALTLFTGTVQAMRQDLTKRLLAFSSIGQIGYIIFGTGACMILLGGGDRRFAPLAAVALLGTLFHVMNHGLAKGLLFLNAGSILHATGTQQINRLGGLLGRMPVTGLTALVAALSISGMPLFNGFAGKWCIYAAAIFGGKSACCLPLCAIMCILTSTLTLVLYIQFFGAIFLARESPLVKASAARGRMEVDWSMRWPQEGLAALCVVIGIAPAAVFSLLQRALLASPQGFGGILAEAVPGAGASSLGGLRLFGGAAVFVPAVFLAVLGIIFLLNREVARIGGAGRRVAEPWLCGYAGESEENRYVARNFCGEIKRRFRWLGGSPASVEDES